jgi:KDO2-lipid IV(A) lauroyltransferase
MLKQGKEESLAGLARTQRAALALLHALAAVLRLFGLGGSVCLAKGAGALYWLLARKRRDFAIASIRRHLGKNPAEAADVARRSIYSNARSFLEMIFTKDFRLENNPRLRINSVFRKMLAEDRPVVATTGHIGAWELLAGLLGQYRTGRPALVVVRNQKSPVFNAFFHQMRSQGNGASIGHRNASAAVLKALRARGTACFLVDHNTLRQEAIFLPFLGEEAAVNIGPALLALRGKAVVYPVFIFRAQKGNYELEAMEPLDSTALQGSIPERTRRIAEFYTKAMERAVREHPEQWLWAHKRWKTRPPGEKSAQTGKDN